MAAFEIRVASIEETPAHFALESDAAWWEAARERFAAQGGEVPLHLRVRLELEGYRIGRRLLFRGRLDATLGLPCSWCVEPVDIEVHEPVELLLEPSQNPGHPPGSGIALDPEDIGLGQYAGEVLDFSELILEILALAWPMQPRGSESCPEKCPRFVGSRPVGPAQGGEKVRPFAGLDRLLEQSRRKASGRGEE